VNKPIRTLAVGCLALFVALLLNINYVQVFKAGGLNDDSRNKRARDEECSRERGPILVNGETVAKSVPSGDSLKFIRKYPEPRKYAQATGYFSCYYGTTAVENTENSILSGSDSRLFVNRVIDLVGNDQPQGGSVLLTLDPAAQQAAVDGLRALGADARGSVIALDPQTGAILAAASQPSYNPNKLATHDFTKARRVYNRLNASDTDKLLNRATQQIYPPGSTFKLVTAAAALSHGRTPNTLVNGNPSMQLPQSSHVLHNENGESCGGGKVTMTVALENSCNVAFAQLGLELGADVLQDQAEKFGFNENVIDELPGAVSNFPTDLNEPNTALSAIGQYEVAASPLQMAMVAAGIANGGEVMKPYIVQEVRSPDLDVLDEAHPEVLHQAVSSTVASELTQMMVDVVVDGTGYNAQIPGVSVAGKTGTANSAPDRPPYAWMVTFAPADDPQVAVAVQIEHSDTLRDDITGNGLAGPICRAVMEAALGQ
jgi:peptidoglycan glycosyltransferase